MNNKKLLLVLVAVLVFSFLSQTAFASHAKLWVRTQDSGVYVSSNWGTSCTTSNYGGWLGNACAITGVWTYDYTTVTLSKSDYFSKTLRYYLTDDVSYTPVWTLDPAYDVFVKTTMDGVKVEGGGKSCTTGWDGWWGSNGCWLDDISINSLSLTLSKSGYQTTSLSPSIVYYGWWTNDYYTPNPIGLSPILYSFTVYTNVNYADVYVNGNWKCYTSSNTYCNAGSYQSGSYTVKVSKSGYYDNSAGVSIPSQSSVTINLSPITYDILVRTADSGVKVSSGSKSCDTYWNTWLWWWYGNGCYLNLPIGSNTITMSKSNYYSKSTDYNLQSNTYTSEVWVLDPIKYSLNINTNYNYADVYVKENGNWVQKCWAGSSYSCYAGTYPIGTYEIKATRPYYNDGTGSVYMDSNKNVNLYLSQIPYKATIYTNVDGVDIKADGSYKCTTWKYFWEGNSHCDVTGLSHGSHSITTYKYGYTNPNTNINGPPDTSATLNLEKNIFSVGFTSNIAGADVYVDNSYKCTTYWDMWTLTNRCGPFDISKGSHTFKGTKTNYQDNTQTVTINGDQTVNFNMQLLTYNTNIYTNVPYVEIYYDGTWACNSGAGKNCIIYSISGSHNIAGKKAGYSDTSGTVSYSSQNLNLNLAQLFKINSVNPSKPNPISGETIKVTTKVDNAYAKDLGWGGYESKVTVNVKIDGNTYSKTATNWCNVLLFSYCTSISLWNYLTGGWAIDVDIPVSGSGAKTISVDAKDDYAETTASGSTSITVTAPTVSGNIKDSTSSGLKGMPVEALKGNAWNRVKLGWSSALGGYYWMSLPGEGSYKMRSTLQYSSTMTDGDYVVRIFNSGSSSPLSKESGTWTASSNMDAVQNIQFSDSEGGQVYRGMQMSYDYWKDKGSIKKADVKLNVPTSCGGANTACNYGDANGDGIYDIDFTAPYQTIDVAAHEWGHSVSAGWGLKRGHGNKTNSEPNPIEESWANFASALSRNDPKFYKYVKPDLLNILGDVVDIRTAQDSGKNDDSLNEVDSWWREWAIAGVMWDVEQQNSNAIYNTLKNSNLRTIYDFYQRLSQFGVSTSTKDTAFKNHGLLGIKVISNEPAADVYIDGTWKCQTSTPLFGIIGVPECSIADVGGGQHTIKLSKSGFYDSTGTVTTPPSVITTINLNKQNPYTITAKTNIPNVDIYLDSNGGSSCNTGSQKSCTISNIVGSHSVTGKKGGYTGTTATVTEFSSTADLTLTQTFKVSSVTPSKTEVNSGENVDVTTKVSGSYYTISGANMESRIKITATINGQTYTTTKTNSCLIALCSFTIANPWDISINVPVTGAGTKTIQITAEDLNAGTLATGSTSVNAIAKFSVSGKITGISAALKGARVELLKQSGSNWIPADSTWTGSDGTYSLAITEDNTFKVRAKLIYSPAQSESSYAAKIFNTYSDFTNNNPFAIESPSWYTSTTPSATQNLDFSEAQGGSIYRGLQMSYDYWKPKGEGYTIDAILDQTSGSHPEGTNRIRFDKTELKDFVAAHEYGHIIHSSWGINWQTNKVSTDSIGEAFADFAAALVRCANGLSGCTQFDRGGISGDIKTVKDPHLTYDGSISQDIQRRLAFAGVMWDLEKQKSNVVYDSLKNSSIQTIYDYYQRVSQFGISQNTKDTAFRNHGFLDIVVSVNVEGAEIYVDNVKKSCTTNLCTIIDVGGGSHTVIAKKTGFGEVSQQITTPVSKKVILSLDDSIGNVPPQSPFNPQPGASLKNDIASNTGGQGNTMFGLEILALLLGGGFVLALGGLGGERLSQLSNGIKDFIKKANISAAYNFIMDNLNKTWNAIVSSNAQKQNEKANIESLWRSSDGDWLGAIGRGLGSIGKAFGDGINWLGGEISDAGKWLNDNVLNPAGQWIDQNIIKHVSGALEWTFDNVLKPIGEFSFGILKSLYNTGKALLWDLPNGIWNWISTSKDHLGDIKNGLEYIWNGLVWSATHPNEAADKLGYLLGEAWKYCSGSATNAGECTGEVVQLFVGGGAVAKIGKVDKITDAIRVVDKISDTEKVVSKISLMKKLGLTDYSQVDELLKLKIVRYNGEIYTWQRELFEVWKANPEIVRGAITNVGEDGVKPLVKLLAKNKDSGESAIRILSKINRKVTPYEIEKMGNEIDDLLKAGFKHSDIEKFALMKTGSVVEMSDKELTRFLIKLSKQDEGKFVDRWLGNVAVEEKKVDRVGKIINRPEDLNELSKASEQLEPGVGVISKNIDGNLIYVSEKMEKIILYDVSAGKIPDVEKFARGMKTWMEQNPHIDKVVITLGGGRALYFLRREKIVYQLVEGI